MPTGAVSSGSVPGHPAAAPGQVRQHGADVRVRHRDLDRRDRLEQGRLAGGRGVLAPRARRRAGTRRRRSRRCAPCRRRSVTSTSTTGTCSSSRPCSQLRAHALLDRADELRRHRAADDLLGELDAGPARQRRRPSTSHTAYCPWPPDCLTSRPCPRASAVNVSRSAIRSGTVSTCAPVARSRSSTTSAWASPRHHSTSWPVSACRSTRTRRVAGGQPRRAPSPARPRRRGWPPRPRSAAAARACPTAPSAAGADFADSVSPVSAVPSRPIAQMSPATARSIGRSVAPSGEKIWPTRSSASWSGCPRSPPPCPEMWTAVSGVSVPEKSAGSTAGRGRGRRRCARPRRAAGRPDRTSSVRGRAAVERHHRRRVELHRGGERAAQHLEQLGQAEPGRGAHRQDRVERAARDGGLEVVDEHLERDRPRRRGSGRAATRPRCC